MKQIDGAETPQELFEFCMSHLSTEKMLTTQDGNSLAFDVLTHLRKGFLPTVAEQEAFLTLIASEPKIPIWARKKIKVAIIATMLPTFAFRKLIWKHNIDMITLPAFFRRITNEQIGALEKAYGQLRTGIVPSECTQTMKEKWLKAKGVMTAQAILNGDFDHRVQPKFLSKGAWSYSLFGLDFGFGQYPNGDKDDTQLSDARWTRFLSKKEHINDFVVNQEGGLYWFLYTFARSNPFWNSGNTVSLASQVCPAFWATMLFNALFWVISPILFLLAMSGAFNGFHWVAKIPVNTIALMTPVLLGLGLLKFLIKSITETFWFDWVMRKFFESDRAKRNWNRFASTLLVIAFGCYLYQATKSLYFEGNGWLAILFVLPGLIFFSPVIIELMVNGIIYGQAKDPGEIIRSLSKQKEGIASKIFSVKFGLFALAVFLLGYACPYSEIISKWIIDMGTLITTYLVTVLWPKFLSFINSILLVIKDEWPVAFFLVTAGFLFWQMSRLLTAKKDPEKIVQFLESRFTVYLMNSAAFCILVFLFMAIVVNNIGQGSMGSAYRVVIGTVFVTVIMVMVSIFFNFFPTTTTVVRDVNSDTGKISYDLMIACHYSFRKIIPRNEFYLVLLKNAWLRNNLVHHHEQLAEKIAAILEHGYLSSYFTAQRTGFTAQLLRQMQEPIAKYLMDMRTNSKGDKKFIGQLVYLYGESPDRFKRLLDNWNISEEDPKQLLKKTIAEYKKEKALKEKEEARKEALQEARDQRFERVFGPLLRLVGAIVTVIFWPIVKLFKGLKWLVNTIKDIGDLIKLFNERCPTVTPAKEL